MAEWLWLGTTLGHAGAKCYFNSRIREGEQKNGMQNSSIVSPECQLPKAQMQKGLFAY